MIIGHQKQLEFLESARAGGKMSHAYIFSGPQKIGKKFAALDWLGKMLDFPLSPGTAHPDFLFVAPLVDEKTGRPAEEIAVAQIRNLIVKLALTPAMGKIKAAIVDQAHLMNSEAQNCLLKTLEEPPGNAVIILITDNEKRLLETIRSRCQTVRFNFLPQNQMESFGLDYCAQNKIKISRPDFEEIVQLSFGRPGRLAEFLTDGKLLAEWQAQIKEFAQIAGAELPEKFAYAKKITDPEAATMNLNEIIEIWQFYFRNRLHDSFKVAGIRSPGINNDKLRGSDPRKDKFVFSATKEDIGQKNIYSEEKISDILKKIQDLSLVLQTTNASPRLAVEGLMLDL